MFVLKPVKDPLIRAEAGCSLPGDASCTPAGGCTLRQGSHSPPSLVVWGGTTVTSSHAPQPFLFLFTARQRDENPCTGGIRTALSLAQFNLQTAVFR